MKKGVEEVEEGKRKLGDRRPETEDRRPEDRRPEDLTTVRPDNSNFGEYKTRF
ncbi:MAG: hypothetical protein JXN62_04780 [Bacteroidales bacterium]|nr:hypothetical protein [Bacteroidales bacterium]